MCSSYDNSISSYFFSPKIKPLDKGVNSGSPVPISTSSDDTEPSPGNKKSLNASESEKSVVEFSDTYVR